MKKVGKYECKKPCSDCPYRTDAKIAHWSIEEFKKVLDGELEEFGTAFDCHKNNGSICIGWLMDQHKRNLPSIMLRISLVKNEVSYKYLESLSSPVKMYDSYIEMVKANFPELFKKRKYKQFLKPIE